MADRPLRPANHRRLGRLLPHQQANGTQTHPPAINLSTRRFYPVLAPVSKSCPRLKGRSSTRYSPVRHCTRHRSDFLVRLACIRHAASVRSEPGSNSQVLILLLLIDSFLIMNNQKGSGSLIKLFVSDSNAEELSAKLFNIVTTLWFVKFLTSYI